MAPSSSSVQSTPTLRLPPPPKPPKPLHLTMSLRQRPGAAGSNQSSYPQMPRWSRTGSEMDEGTVRGRTSTAADEQNNDQEEEQEATAALNSLEALFVPSGEERSLLDTPSSAPTRRTRRRQQQSSEEDRFLSARSGGGSTIKVKRASIFFDSSQPNPLLPPTSTPSTEQAEQSDEDLLAAAESELSEASSSTIDQLLDPDQSLAPCSDSALLLDLPPMTLSALSLHAFEGESAFGELSFPRGAELCIEVDDLGGNWSLGYLGSEGDSGRGLVPRGFYAYIEAPEESNVDPSPVSPDAPSTTFAPPSTSPAPSSTLKNSSFPPVSELEAPSSPSYASRSLGRSVIVSGVEFEPAIPTPSPRLPLPTTPGVIATPASYFDEWRGEQQAVETPPPTKEEMREFFSPAKGASGSLEPAGVIEVDGRVAQEVREGQQAEEEAEADTSFDAKSTGASILASPASATSQVRRAEREGAPSPSPAPPSPFALSSKPRLLFTDDSQEAREARWSALVEQAENRASRMGLDSLFEAEEDEEEQGQAQQEDEESSIRLAPLEEGPIASPPITYPAPTPPTNSSSASTMLYRLGLGSSSTINSLASASLPTRPALTRGGSTKNAFAPARGVKGGLVLVRDWIRRGDEEQQDDEGESAEVWHIESGPAWRVEAPPFTVVVHSPERRPSLGSRSEHTVYQLTTLFSWPSSLSTSSASEEDDESITVERRFSHFVALHALLTARFPIITLPDLPSRTFAGRFDAEFVETRRRDLERWLSRIGKSDVLRGSSELRSFLVTDNEKDLQALLNLSAPPPASFFSRVFHPEFNVDPAEAQELVECFERHVKASQLGGGMREVEAAVGQVRAGMRDSSQSQLALAHSLARLAAGFALPPSSSDTIAGLGEDNMQALEDASESQREHIRAKAWCLQTEEGAYSFKEGDNDALSTTKAVQATAEAISEVATLQDGSARDDLLIVQELLREISYPHSHYSHVIETHKFALIEHQRLTSEPDHQEDAIGRCETILNITSAEIERAHTERTEDLRQVAEQYLDSQIAMHEQALTHLRFARTHFAPSAFAALAQTGPRLRSTLESTTRAPLSPLPQPSSYGGPSSASAAVSQAFGSVLGLNRSSSTRSESAVRGIATAGTVGRSAKETLRSHGSSLVSSAIKENIRKEEEQPRSTWRASIFGTARFW